MRTCFLIVFLLVPNVAAFFAGGRAKARAAPPRAEAASPDSDQCLVDEPVIECALRRQVDGPWADGWARFVLLRPGMSFGELKAATLRRNELDPKDRIPGTYRTVILTHLVCFLAAIPAILTSDAVFPKLVQAAAVSRAAAGQL